MECSAQKIRYTQGHNKDTRGLEKDPQGSKNDPQQHKKDPQGPKKDPQRAKKNPRGPQKDPPNRDVCSVACYIHMLDSTSVPLGPPRSPLGPPWVTLGPPLDSLGHASRPRDPQGPTTNHASKQPANKTTIQTNQPTNQTILARRNARSD